MQTVEVKATHTPVMLAEVVEGLRPALASCAPSVPSVFVDATVGLGGHSAALLAACPGCRVVGIDRDGDALAIAADRLSGFPGRVDLVRARFDEMADVLDDLGIGAVRAVLFDLGLSSLQIDRPERGFAYSQDAPLDMRMDDRADRTAADLVNEWSVADLERILSDYGEEPHARRVAQAIVAARATTPITTTSQLVSIVTQAMPAAVRYGSGGHPAKRAFQALRIAVNDELVALAAALPVACARLAVGGRVAALSYHSLEDRIVKRTFRAACAVAAPRRLPIVPPSLEPRFASRVEAARPGVQEITSNPRAASARLRVIERIKEA